MTDISGEKFIPVTRSLRYFERPTEKSSGIHLVYLLHGYGQLAYYFLKKAAEVLPENVWFVAPEGTHRFYLNGTSGRVGASWMTREMREIDIAENTALLDELHSKLSAEINPDKITVVGFSQGGATAARWVGNGRIAVDHFVSWASVFPPDIEFPESMNEGMEKTFVIGNNDQFFDEEAVEKAIAEYQSRGFGIASYNGKHDLDPRTLEKILSL